MDWFFAREYLLLKEEFQKTISEIEMDNRVKETFDIIKNLDYHCSDEEFIQLFVSF